MRYSLILSFLFGALGVASGQTPEQTQQPSEAAQLFETAMQFELDGDNNYRNMTLRAAINSNNDFAPAHWQLGEVKDNGIWKSVSSLELTNDESVRAYGQRRNHALGNSEAEFALAKWCLANQLADRARFHYARVAFDPRTSDTHRRTAIKRAKLKEYNGQFVNEQQYDLLQERDGDYQDAMKKWDPQMAKWREALLGSSNRKREKALEALATIQTADAIPSMERILSPAGEPIALRVVEVLDKIPHHEATLSLVRHAVSAPWPSVMQASTAALKKRPMHEYVPALLSGLDTPVYIKSQWRTATVKDRASLVSRREGNDKYLFIRDTVVFKEGIDHNVLVQNHHLSGPSGHGLILRLSFDGRVNGPANIEPIGWGRAASATNDPKAVEEELLRGAIRSAVEQKRLRASVAESNARIENINAHLFSILESTTGQVLPQRSTEWWDWWHDYNEVSDGRYGGDKPTYVSESYTSNIPVVVRRQSCFVAGTPVWTDLGQRPIESLSIGDRVLSQHPDTGELSFQLVTTHTVRPPTEMVQLQLGEEVISSTKGHPFWLNGVGWRMAKLLEPKQRLHSLCGSVTVTSVTPTEKQEAHNLVVAGTGTYFVGEAGLLVHDNTYRQPTRAAIPGVLPKKEPVESETDVAN